jgi:hypothetical protein
VEKLTRMFSDHIFSSYGNEPRGWVACIKPLAKSLHVLVFVGGPVLVSGQEIEYVPTLSFHPTSGSSSYADTLFNFPVAVVPRSCLRDR